MGEDNQFRARFNPRITGMLAELSAMEGMDEADFVASLICQQAMVKAKIVTAPIFRESAKEIRSIVFEKLERLHTAEILKRGKDAEKWVAEEIEDARAAVAERKQSKIQRYYLKLRGRTVGPHRLDKLREWVHFKILSEDVIAIEAGERKSQYSIGAIPNFREYPASLRRKLAASAAEPPKDWHAKSATDNQIRRLDFFDIPYEKKGLRQGRASELITQFAFIDPEKEKQYNLTEKGK